MFPIAYSLLWVSLIWPGTLVPSLKPLWYLLFIPLHIAADWLENSAGLQLLLDWQLDGQVSQLTAQRYIQWKNCKTVFIALNLGFAVLSALSAGWYFILARLCLPPQPVSGQKLDEQLREPTSEEFDHSYRQAHQTPEA